MAYKGIAFKALRRMASRYDGSCPLAAHTESEGVTEIMVDANGVRSEESAIEVSPMLLPEQIKPQLLNEDPYVRNAAADYFGRSWSRDPDIAPLILTAWERFGHREDISGLYFLERLPLTEEAFENVLAVLAAAEKELVIRNLNLAVAMAPVGLLADREAVILETPNFDHDALPQIRQRRELATWPAERLWEELQDFSRRSNEAATTGDLDLGYSSRLIEALAPHEVPDGDTICRMLQDPEISESWLEIFLIELAGARRLREAIPSLVARFHIDTDYMLEQTSDALARIGDPEAVRLIGEAYPTASEGFKTYSTGVLGNLKAPESEAVILTLLETEEDEFVRLLLCDALCELFSEPGVEVVKNEIELGYDEYFVNLKERLLPVTDVLGITLPDAERWKRLRDWEHERLERRLAEMEKYGWGSSRTAVEDAGLSVETDIEPEADVEVTMPIHRSGPKVGRNDPCPCGSGKKYKKCCGRPGHSGEPR